MSKSYTPISHSETGAISAQQSLLSQQILDNTLPHAILISGVKGAGKRQLANWLVSVLLCSQVIRSAQDKGIIQACGQCKACLLNQNNTYPDHLKIKSETRTIGVDEIRHVSHFLEKTAQLGALKTVVIEQAQKMTLAAANALLKTLEEPTANSIIVLLCVQSERLLPTITSRCRLVEIRHRLTPSANHNADSMTKEVSAARQSFRQLFLSYLVTRAGRIELIKVLKTDPDAFAWLQCLLSDLVWRQQANSNGNDLAADKLTSNEWQSFCSAGQVIEAQNLWQVYQLVKVSSKQLATLSQANPEFVLEKLLLDIEQAVTDHQH